MLGLLKLENVMLIGIDKKDMNDGSYYYNLAFTTGKEVIQLTCGKKADDMVFGKYYNLGLNYIDKKLKLVDFEIVK